MPTGSGFVFGPVRSRRLGWSLGINNVPAKTCTYSCVYCQLGRTDRARVVRSRFHDPAHIVAAVSDRLLACRAAGQPVDYATFVPDGEPTLDHGLGETIRAIQGLGIRVAVLTNGSLLWQSDVRADLASADLVSVKVDAVREETWREIDRPIGTLRHVTVLEGLRHFAAEYAGSLLTETMLVAGLNDGDADVRATADFVDALEPVHAFVAIPTRPPAEAWVRAPTMDAARCVCDRFRAYWVPTSCLLEETDERAAPFAVSPNAAAGLLAIVAVHPMTESAARDYLERAGAGWSIAEALLEERRVVAVRHGGRTFLRAAR